MTRLLSVLIMLFPAVAQADVVLWLDVASDEAAHERQQRVADELVLALDGVELRPTAVPIPGFVGESVGGQIAALKSLFEDQEVRAALWLDPTSQELLRVQLVFPGESARSEVRLVEQPAGEGASAVLALGVREVLATTGRRVMPAPVEPPPPQPPPPPSPLPPIERVRRGGLGFDLGLTGGTPVRVGPNARLAAFLVGDVFLGGGVIVSPFAALRFGGTPASGLVTTGGGGGARLAWTPGGRLVRFGPFLGVSAVWMRVSAPGADGRLHADQLQVRVPLGAALRARLGPGVDLVGHLAVDVLPRRVQVRLRSTSDMIVDTGPLDVTFTVGLRFLP